MTTTTDTTAVQTTTGEALLVETDDTAQVLRFLDDDDQVVATYTHATFAEVRSALVLAIGAGVVLDDETVAGLQQWARIA